MAGKKYSVLFADDEYWTREKMKSIIDWERYQLEFLKPAADGEEVVNRIGQECPDILITDIDMPIINGVELIKKLKVLSPDTIIFVISGYNDFDYVKDSMKWGAINYLIKPVTKIDLIHSLSEAMELISERQAGRMEKESIQAELKKASSLLEDREFSMMIDKKEPLLMPDISLNINMEFAGTSLILIKIHNPGEVIKSYKHDMNLLSYSIKRIIRESLNIEEIIVFNNIYRSNEFIVVSRLENHELKQFMQKLIFKLEQLMQSPISIVLSQHSFSMESLHMAYVQAVSMLMGRKYESKSVIIDSSLPQNKIGENVSLNQISEEIENRIKLYIKSNNKKQFKMTVNHLLKQNDFTYLEVKQIVKKITNFLLDIVMGKNDTQETIAAENLEEFTNQSIEYLNNDIVIEAINEMIDLTIEPKEVKGDVTMQGIVRQIAAYIDKNYFEELTLAELSNRYAVESSYLSKMFKQEKGDNLMVYIAKTRIAKAKEYIRENRTSLTEIAFLVGYDDYSYFNRVFRKITGKSPREYKREVHA